MRSPAFAIIACCFVASCTQADTSSPANPDDFSLRMTVDAAAGKVQRVDLPASALIAFQRKDRGDVRIFDAHDRPLSLAIVDDRATMLTATRLSPIPYAATSQRLTDTPISVTIDSGAGRVAVTSGAPAGVPLDKAILFDARRLSGAVTAIKLDADIPVGQPVPVNIASSSDLKIWQPLGEAILFRAEASGPIVGADRIELADSPVAGRYIRLSWAASSNARFTSAVVTTTGGPVPPRVTVAAKLSTMADPHHIDFAIGSSMTPVAIHVRMTGKDGVLPLRLLGRNIADEPWSLLAVAGLRQDVGYAKLALNDQEKTLFRIEADRRSAGFSQPPSLSFEYDPISLLAAFNGDAPYHLAIGNSAAPPAFFAAADLTEMRAPFPRAKVNVGTADQRAIVIVSAPRSGPAPRTILLWLSLVIGVAALAYVAYRLMKPHNPDTN
jgi:Protein of unknown function (DUF3999)